MKRRNEYDEMDLLEYRENCPHPFYLYGRFSDTDSDFVEVNPCRWLFQYCQAEHPNISLESQVLGGIPHINKTRLSVGQVLGRLYVLGSVEAVVKYYSPNISEEQIKEAIAFAQDFVELAGDPSQTYD